VSGARFITFRLTDTENARNINPFYIEKALGGISGKVKRRITSEE
jgi:hypothetical protein